MNLEYLDWVFYFFILVKFCKIIVKCIILIDWLNVICILLFMFFKWFDKLFSIKRWVILFRYVMEVFISILNLIFVRKIFLKN